MEKNELKDNYRANVEDKDYNALKRAYNLYLIISSGIADYLHEHLTPSAIILFGSFARGDNHAASDIDIAILDAKAKLPSINKFEEKFKYPISLHLVELEKATPEFKNNILNGIVIKGFVKVF